MGKRKIIALLLVVGLAVSACSCGKNANTKTESKASSKEISSAKTNHDFESVNINDTIVKDFCIITITKSIITHAANEQKTGLNLEEKEDNVYIVFLGTIKNTATFEMNFLSGFKTRVLVDDEYSYPVEIVTNNLKSIVPLKTVDFAAYASVPEEVISSCETYTFQFGFNDNLDINLSSIDESAYKFQITGKIDEYGSTEQIQNFQTFVEYISSFISTSGYNEKFTVKRNNEDQVVLVENGNCLKYVSGENIKVNIYPGLKLHYNSYEHGIYEYGELKMRVSGSRKQDNIHYISTEAITVKSNAGEITIGEGVENIYDFDNVRATNTFYFNPGKLSLEELYSIINGEDLEIVLNVATLENENTFLTYECDDELKENLIELIDIYRQLPKASLSK